MTTITQGWTAVDSFDTSTPDTFTLYIDTETGRGLIRSTRILRLGDDRSGSTVEAEGSADQMQATFDEWREVFTGEPPVTLDGHVTLAEMMAAGQTPPASLRDVAIRDRSHDGQLLDHARQMARYAYPIPLKDDDRTDAQKAAEVRRMNEYALWELELLTKEQVCDQYISLLDPADVAERRQDIADYQDVCAKPVEIRAHASAAGGVTCSITGEEITGSHVTLYDRREEETTVTLSPEAVARIVGADIAAVTGPPADPADLPDGVPLTPDQVRSLNEATTITAMAHAMLRRAAEVSRDALTTWAETTDVASPDMRFDDNWPEACGITRLTDAARPLHDLVNVLTTETVPAVTEEVFAVVTDTVIHGVTITSETIARARALHDRIKPHADAIRQTLDEAGDVIHKLYKGSEAVGLSVETTATGTYDERVAAEDTALEYYGQITGFSALYNLLSDLAQDTEPEELYRARDGEVVPA